MPARIVSPIDLGMPPVVEKITQPLYDTVRYAAAVVPAQNIFFSVAFNGTEVAGGGAKTFINTNLDQAGQLSAPKLFTITAISSVWQQFDGLSGGRTNSIDLGTLVEPQDLNDIRELVQHAAFKLHIGTKDYLDVPLWRIPGNYGVGGWAAAASLLTAAAGSEQWFLALQQVGVRYSILPVPILIPSQQTFRCEVNFDVMIAPFAAVLPTIVNVQRQWILLHGVLGREVQ